MKNQKINILILSLITILVIYFILKDDFLEITKTVSTVNIGWFVFSIGIIILYWLFQTLCLSAIAESSGKVPSFKTLFKSTLISHLFSAITPSASGGQPFQIYYLKKKGLDLGTSTNYVVAQATLYQIALVLFGLVAILLNSIYDFFPFDNIIKYLVLIGFAMNVIVISVLLFIMFGKKTNKKIVLKLISFLHKIKIIRNKEKVEAKAEQAFDNFYVSSKLLRKHPNIIVKGSIYNFIALMFLYITPLTVAYSFGNYVDLNILTTLVASAYVMLIGAFIPIPGGSGGIEYAFATLFGFYLTGPLLMATLLIWRFLTYYLGILLGGILLITNRKEEK